MSNDLISRASLRDKLIKAHAVLLETSYKAKLAVDPEMVREALNQMAAIETVIKILDAEPTAYDIDKVVEQLKAFNNTLRDPLENRAIEDAIEIVKAAAEKIRR